VGEPCIAVIDVGKTHSKVSIWDQRGQQLGRRDRANAKTRGGHYHALDAADIESWIAATLKEFSRLGDISTLIPVGHGAGAAILRYGRLVCAPMDYEQFIPDAVQSRYASLRDDFDATGSPRLPFGLNLGAQLHWLQELDPRVLQGDALILPWAQYWAWVLCGVAASEATSWGCHTDLWRPLKSQPSSLAIARDWAPHFAPLRRATDVLGALRPEWVARTGISADARVLCGIHDSNAALLAARGFSEIAEFESTVVSTGTWFLAMRTPAAAAEYPRLAEHRDNLMNVDAYGKPIPSSRFMGGREIELLNGEDAQRIDTSADQPEQLTACTAVVRAGARVLPTLAPGVGPYPHARYRWDAKPSNSIERRTATALYAALVADMSLELIGARERILIEGRFADSEVFVRALASLRPDAAVYVSHAHNGVPYGALRLLNPGLPPPGALRRIEPLSVDLSSYRTAWRNEADRLEQAAW
jgi:sugar (pentulose or hexulose) kinase